MSCSKNISNIKWICLLLISRLKNLAHWNKSEVLPSLDASFISRFTAFLCLLSSNFLSKLLMDSKTVRIWSSIAGSISAETARLLNFWLYSAKIVIESILLISHFKNVQGFSDQHFLTVKYKHKRICTNS